MAKSLLEVGQISPVGVIKGADGYELLYGNTRLLAAQSLDWDMIEAKVFSAIFNPQRF